MNKSSFVINREQLEVVQQRIFDVPRELLFKTISDPALIPQWWGPRRYSTKVDKMDFRVGGQWRFINIDDKGNEYAFHGVYKEIIPNTKVVDTFNFEPIPGDHELLETLLLESIGENQTKMTSTAKYQTIQDLEGMNGSGMEQGAIETWDRLDELVTK